MTGGSPGRAASTGDSYSSPVSDVPGTSTPGLVTGAFVALLGLPFLLRPRTCARLRYRHARDPEPTEGGVREARLGGLVLLGFGLLIALAH